MHNLQDFASWQPKCAVDLDVWNVLNLPPENALKLLQCKVYEIDSFFYVSICKQVLSVSSVIFTKAQLYILQQKGLYIELNLNF